MENTTLWMGAVQPNWTEEFLQQLFLEEIGETVSVKLFKNNLGPYDPNFYQVKQLQPIGYAFIEFRSHEVAELAREKLGNTPIKGTNVVYRLNWAVRDKKKSSREKEQKEHSLFVGDIAEDVTDEILFNTFRERFPSCTSGNIVIDPTTGHSKKYGFVRFSAIHDYYEAMQTMNGVVVGSRAIRVGKATAKHQTQFVDPFMAPYPLFRSPASRVRNLSFDQQPSQIESPTIFVGNLTTTVTELELRQHFEDCGTVVEVTISSHNKGCGFVRFSNLDEAQRAFETKQRSRVGGSKIRVEWSKDRSYSSEMTATTLPNGFMQQPQPVLNVPNMNQVAMGMNQQPFYNYNYFGYVAKPYGFYSMGAQSTPSIERMYSNVNDLTLSMNGLNLKQTSMETKADGDAGLNNYGYNFG